MTREALAITPSYPINGVGPYQYNNPYIQGALRALVELDDRLIALEPGEYIADPLSSNTSGSIALTIPAASAYNGGTLYILRQTDIEQGFAGQSARENGLAAQLDWMTEAIQDTAREVRRSLRSTAPINPFPIKAGRILTANLSGDGFTFGPTIEDLSQPTTRPLTAKTIPSVAAMTTLVDGQQITVESGDNDQSEDFFVRLTGPQATLTANGTTVVDAVGMGDNPATRGRLISQRKVYTDWDELDTDIRKLADGTRIKVSGRGYYTVDSLTPNFTTAAGLGLRVHDVLGKIRPEMIGAKGDRTTDDLAKVKAAGVIANSIGATLLLSGAYLFDTATAGPDPSGHAGDYQWLLEHPLKIEGTGAAEIIVPGNEHGIIQWADNFEIDGVQFTKKPETIAGTIGQYIKCPGARDGSKLNNCKFFDCSDAGYASAMDLVSILANYENPGFDIFDYMPTNVSITKCFGAGVKGDAAFELLGTDVLCENNKVVGADSHGIRPVGVRNARILSNDISGCALAGIAAYSGGHTPSGAPSAILLRNEDVEIDDNKIRSSTDGIWLGIGAKTIKATNNNIGVTGKAFQISHILDIADFGLADAEIYGNTIRGGEYPFYVQINTNASISDALRDVDIHSNTLAGYTKNAFLVSVGLADRPLRRAHFRRNILKPADSSVTSTFADYQSTVNLDCDLRGNVTSAKNGKEILVFSTDTDTKFPLPDRLKVLRAANNLIREAGAKTALRLGQKFVMETDGTLPSGLSTNTEYYAILNSSSSYRVATSFANAVAGSGVALSDAGTGNFWIVPL